MTDYKKLALYYLKAGKRRCIVTIVVCAPETLLALATDTPARVDGVETIGLEDYARAAGILLHAMRR